MIYGLGLDTKNELLTTLKLNQHQNAHPQRGKQVHINHLHFTSVIKIWAHCHITYIGTDKAYLFFIYLNSLRDNSAVKITITYKIKKQTDVATNDLNSY